MYTKRWIWKSFFVLLSLALIGCQNPFEPEADLRGARVTHFTIDSRFVKQKLRQAAVIPEHSASKQRSLILFLHGRGSTPDEQLTQPFLNGLKALGSNAPVVVFVAGSSSSYWHNRRSGDWAAYIMREVLPQTVRRFHINPYKVAVGGISMGGFGALDIARLYPKRFCAAGGHSPAIWQTGGETAAGAFDDAEDFARHNLVQSAQTEAHRFKGTKLWLDVGSHDPFLPGVQAFVRALKRKNVTVDFHEWQGGHDVRYWSEHWARYLRFYESALQQGCGSRK